MNCTKWNWRGHWKIYLIHNSISNSFPPSVSAFITNQDRNGTHSLYNKFFIANMKL